MFLKGLNMGKLNLKVKCIVSTLFTSFLYRFAMLFRLHIEAKIRGYIRHSGQNIRAKLEDQNSYIQ